MLKCRSFSELFSLSIIFCSDARNIYFLVVWCNYWLLKNLNLPKKCKKEKCAVTVHRSPHVVKHNVIPETTLLRESETYIHLQKKKEWEKLKNPPKSQKSLFNWVFRKTGAVLQGYNFFCIYEATYWCWIFIYIVHINQIYKICLLENDV